MSWLLEIIIESLDSKGLWKLFCILPLSPSQENAELLRNLNKLINKANDNNIDPATLNRE